MVADDDRSEEELFKLTLSGDVIPNVSENFSADGSEQTPQTK